MLCEVSKCTQKVRSLSDTRHDTRYRSTRPIARALPRGVQAPIRRLYTLGVLSVGQKSLRHNTIAPRRRDASLCCAARPKCRHLPYRAWPGRQLKAGGTRPSETIVRWKYHLPCFPGPRLSAFGSGCSKWQTTIHRRQTQTNFTSMTTKVCGSASRRSVQKAATY